MTRFIDSSKGPERPCTLPAVLLAGPTASGKTSLSIELCRAMSGRFPVEIVNADSMQVYRRMDVGTAKPTIEERSIVPHHLIDIADPDEHFDAARYLSAARPKIEELRLRGILPLVVGGTGLYMRVLTRGLCSGPPSNPEVKEHLISMEKSHGLEHLYRELLQIDPESAARIHPNDRQRIIRALEVFYIGGVALSVLQKGHGFRQELFPTVKIFINRERDVLFERINRRVDRMIEGGLKAEVEGLFSMGFGPELKSMQSIGYRQMAAHLAGAISLDEAVFEIKQETRRYAKRQITWFRADSEFRCFDADDVGGIYLYIRKSTEHALFL
ncbi:MAG: tRNA (adenosine(37)-N6)-dimethylallyltransferase MiaA [Deltaproteobacteria bacterium]|nr:tRNA (adenosine(37)-N6)-dimethylallyltransferase MiaA [Deltaproteobacteria bacterium]MDA8305384.1 tRNA (adenosine(37)-N6)-dimethylallyltransferase MiaA [Deltaproteobacteria bacterium]